MLFALLLVATSPLADDLQVIANAAPARLGVFAKNLATGEEVSVAGDAAFPMQSTFKLPVAIALLREVDKGKLKLQDKLFLTIKDVRGGPTGISSRIGAESASISVVDLLTEMVENSDNTAVDALLPRLGGPRGVTQKLQALGLKIKIERSERELQCDNNGVPPQECPSLSAAGLAARQKATPMWRRRKAIDAYLSDPRDTVAPQAMAQVLEALYLGKLLSPASTTLLEKLLQETQTGALRLKAGLPSGTRLLHKTGSGMVLGDRVSVANDAGIIFLPSGKAAVVSVYLCDGIGESEDVEGVIAEVAQAVWSHWAVVDDTPRRVSISLDDLPQVDETPRLSAQQRNGLLIQALADRHLQAAIYVVARGAQSADGLALLKQWSEAGHRIGNHTFKHPSIDKVPLADFEKDFSECDKTIAGLAGYFRFFRFPYLKEGKTADARDGFRQFLAAQHYRAAEVTIDASDWYYNERLSNFLRQDANADTSAHRDAYVAHLLDRAQYYDNLARRVTGRSPAHVLLAHASLLNALFLPDVLAAFAAHGWTWIAPEAAYADQIYTAAPQTLPAGESLVWSLAKEKAEPGLRYPGEDSTYEKAKLDALGL